MKHKKPRPTSVVDPRKPETRAYPLLPTHDEIMTGFRPTAVAAVAEDLGLSTAEVASRIGLTRSTFHRKRKAGARLTEHESDMLVRYTTLHRHAMAVFDHDEAATRQWLSCPQIGLGGAVPLDFARTTVGFQEVEKLLTRIDYSVYA